MVFCLWYCRLLSCLSAQLWSSQITVHQMQGYIVHTRWSYMIQVHFARWCCTLWLPPYYAHGNVSNICLPLILFLLVWFPLTLMESGHSVVKAVPRTQTRTNPHPGIITPMSTVPRSISDSEQRFLTVSLSGESVWSSLVMSSTVVCWPLAT